MDRPLIILVAVMTALLLAVVFLVGLAVGAGSQGHLSFSSDTLSSWVSALATTVIAVLTIVLARETWRLRKIQLAQIEQIRKDAIKPSISVLLKSARVGIHFMDIHGSGTAQNVRFSFSNQNPDAQDVYDYVKEQIDNLAFLEDGIASLGPGQEMTSYLPSFLELNGKLPDHSFDFHCLIDVHYHDSGGSTRLSQPSTSASCGALWNLVPTRPQSWRILSRKCKKILGTSRLALDGYVPMCTRVMIGKKRESKERGSAKSVQHRLNETAANIKLKLTKKPVTSVACVTAAPEPLDSLTWCYAYKSRMEE